MHIRWNSTTVLAIYAAILSTFTFSWNLFRDLRDRGKLKISAAVRRIAVGANGAMFSVQHDFPAEGVSQQLFIVMTVANVGRRPMRWEAWGGLYKNASPGKNGFICMARHLPKILGEKDHHQEYTDLEDEFDLLNIRKLYMWDGAGGEWKLSWWQLRKLVKEAKEARTAKSSA